MLILCCNPLRRNCIGNNYPVTGFVIAPQITPATLGADFNCKILMLFVKAIHSLTKPVSDSMATRSASYDTQRYMLFAPEVLQAPQKYPPNLQTPQDYQTDTCPLNSSIRSQIYSSSCMSNSRNSHFQSSDTPVHLHICSRLYSLPE